MVVVIVVVVVVVAIVVLWLISFLLVVALPCISFTWFGYRGTVHCLKLSPNLRRATVMQLEKGQTLQEVEQQKLD